MQKTDFINQNQGHKKPELSPQAKKKLVNDLKKRFPNAKIDTSRL